MGEQDDTQGRVAHDRGKADAFLITGAPTPYDVQHRARVRRYLTLMAFRIPALVAGGVVYSMTGSAWWAVGIVVLSIPLPWIAVLIANDRPPRKRGELPNYLHGSDHDALGPQSIGATGPVLDGGADASPRTPAPRTIDSTTVDPPAAGS